MSALTVRFSRAASDAALERDWRALEARAPRPFFLSWAWIGTAMEKPPKGLFLARITEGERVVALALLQSVVETRHRLFSIRQLRVNEIGGNAGDLVPGEFTTLLAEMGAEEAAWRALLDALGRNGAPRWSEIVVTNARAETEAMIARILGGGDLRVHRRAEAGSGLVDLEALRAAGVSDLGGYLKTLGRSTRSAIQRSLRLYSERGQVRLERARSSAEAENWFRTIVRLQTAKWRGRGRKGIADLPFLLSFQERLNRRALETGGVEILRLSAGAEPFAYLHNYVDGGDVLFNIGGFCVEANNQLKPGLVAHALAVESHLKSGAKTYDFLAGDDRYKTSLGRKGPDFTSFAIQKKTPALQLEDRLRRLKNRKAARK